MKAVRDNLKRIGWAAAGAFVASVTTAITLADEPIGAEAAAVIASTAGWAAFRAGWFVLADIVARRG